MRRRVLRCVLLLLMGATITVAVSWAVAVRYHLGSGWAPPADLVLIGQDAADRGWPARVPPLWPEPEGWVRQRVLGVTSIFAVRNGDSGTPARIAESVRFGWPCRAAEYARISKDTDGTAFPALVDRSIMPGVDLLSFREGLVLVRPLGSSAYVPLPLRPLPLGFAADTLVYASGAWALLAGAGRIRRRRRRRRGRCSGCGYPRAGLAPDAACPECGEEVRR